MGKKIIRIYTGTDGESHFEDIEIPFPIKRSILESSEPIKATEVIFADTGIRNETGWHNASRRQFFIILEGEHEIEVTNGTKRILGPGDILLAEDTTGKGHTVRPLGDKPHRVVFVALDPEAIIP